jgi:hypothetical protein
MSQQKQHDAKRSKGPQRETGSTSKAADTGSAAKNPPREQAQRQQREPQRKKG